MKKKLLSCLMVMLTLFLVIKNTKAASCSYAEQADLNNEAANVKVTYEAQEEEISPEGYICDGGDEEDVCPPVMHHYININILNLSENFYITVTDDVTKNTQRYDYSQVPEDGILKIEWDDVSKINTFDITVYSSNNTTCPDTKIKVSHITVPRRNYYSEYAICQEVPDYYLCKEYVTYEEDPSFGEFMEKVENEIKGKTEEEKKEKEKGFFDKLLDFLDKYKIALIVGTAIIIVLVTGIVIIIRRKRRL